MVRDGIVEAEVTHERLSMDILGTNQRCHYLETGVNEHPKNRSITRSE